MSLNIQNRELDPTNWISGDWAAEAAENAIWKAPAFGRDFFRRLFSEWPEFENRLLFLRCASWPEDIFAILDVDVSAGGFLVQIDPDLEYVVVCNAVGQGEYGDWREGFDKIEEALKQIRTALGC